MKRFMISMLMVLFVVVSASAQLIIDWRDNGHTAVIAGGMTIDITRYPGWPTYQRGYTVQENMTRYLNELRQRNPEEYVRQIRLASASGISVPVMGGVGVAGVGVAGVGTSGGTGDILPVWGSGVYASYDTGTNSLSIGGDPIMAVARTLDYFGGKFSSKKKKAARAAAAAAQQQAQQVTVVYVDSATGQVVKVQQGAQVQSTQTRSAQPTATTTTATANPTTATTFAELGF